MALARWAGLGILLALAVIAPGPAPAFRYVPVGSRVPLLTLQDMRGTAVEVPRSGRLTIIVFWRPGQSLSEQALADLMAVAREVPAGSLDLIAVAEGAAAPPAASAGGSALTLLVDHDGRAAEAYGVIVVPSTALVGGDGRLLYYLPSRGPAYRGLIAAHLAHARGELSDAELARRAAQLGETYGAAAERAQAAYRRGVALAEQRRWDEARDALAQALAAAPEHVDAELLLGWVELELGAPAAALTHFERVLARNPASPAARMGRGIVRLRMGQVEEGIRLLEEAVELNPEPVRGHVELARAYEARGDLERALEHYRWAYRKLLQGRK
jgi:tetratricopeptide (TPR) repeat protein